MKPDYDVVVVGGRVAGAATAMLLARRGHRVLIVERSPMPSDTVSTHAIMRTGVLQLRRWGLTDRLDRLGAPGIRAMTLGFGGERIHFDVKPDFGVDRIYAPRRHLFDQMLLDAAMEAGAELATRTRATAVVEERDRVSGLVLQGSGRTSKVGARFVVGADGARSRIAGWVGARHRRSHPPLNAVNYAYYSGIDQEGCWFQFTPGANAGLIPTNDGQTLVFVGRPTALAGRFHACPDREFDRLLRYAGADLAEKVRSGDRATGYRGTRGLTGSVRQPAGPGWALVGDAGYVKDPISAHGMSQAMRDAELLARAIDRSLDGACDSPLADFERTRGTLSTRIYEESEQLASYRWDAEEASGRMRRISESIRRECAAMTALPDWEPVRRVAGV